MNKLLIVVVIAVAIAGALIGLWYFLNVSSKPSTQVCQINKDNTFFVIYYSIPPNATVFNHLMQSIQSYITSNSSGAINLTLTLCIRKFSEVDEATRNLLSPYKTFPIFGIYTSKDLSAAKGISNLFDVSGRYYIARENITIGVYSYLAYYGVSILKEPRVFIETFEKPTISLEETPVIGSLNAKYYLIIYEDAWCPFCAKFYKESIPTIEHLVSNNTFAIVLKNLIVHSGVVNIHRNLTSLYVVTKNATLVFNLMKKIYDYVYTGSNPSPEIVASMIKNLTGIDKFDVNLNKIDEIIKNDELESRRYGVFGTPGIVIWSRESGRGVVIVGYASADDILNIVRSYLT